MVSNYTDEKSSPVFLGKLSFWRPYWDREPRTGVKNGSNIKNTLIKLKLYNQGFFEVRNWGIFCYFRATRNSQSCDYFQKSHSLSFFYVRHHNLDIADQYIKITTIVAENSF